MAEEIKVDLDPKKVLDAVAELKESIGELAVKIEASLGKDAPKSIGKLEDAAEKGTGKIAGFFRNLGTQVRENLKTAFNVSEVMGGMKFAKDIGEGAKQVFQMERAFDRLNTRLGLTASKMEAFKRSLGRGVAGAGQKLEDILPGVETAAAKGGVRSPADLAAIGTALAKVKAATGEGVEGVADNVIEILKAQGQKISADSFKQTLDAIQGTRTTGAFKTAGEAGNAIEALAPFAKKLGLTTRELGGLAATAGRGGSAGQDILRQLFEKGTTIGGQQQLNAVFGRQIFKNGKLDASEIGKINTERYGKQSQQILEQTTGLSGASGADLTRFVESFRTGMGDFRKVVSGADETSAQFETATDNMASKVEEFKEGLKEAGRELGGGLAQMVKDLKGGAFKKAVEDLKGIGKTAWENKGAILTGVGTTAVVGALAGGGLGRLLKKGGGKLGGLAGNVIGEAAAEAAGIQKVYVVNAGEMGGGGAEGTAGAAAGIGGKIGKGIAALGVGVAAYEVTSALMNTKLGQKQSNFTAGLAHDVLYGASEKKHILANEAAQNAKGAASFNARHGTTLTPDQFADAVEKGTLKAMAKNKPNYTNPSSVTGRGTSH